MPNRKQVHKFHPTILSQTASTASPPDKTPLRPLVDNREPLGPREIIETDFCKLPDGTLLEMIQDPNDATKSVLASSQNGQAHLTRKVELGNQILVPLPRSGAILRDLRLANGLGSLESARDLHSRIVHFLSKTVELTAQQTIALGCFVLATWVIERLPCAPYVAFVGPPGSGKTTALWALSLLCRRSLFTSDISSSAFYSICDRMTPTVLIDETATVDNRRQLLHALRSGTCPDVVTVRKNQTFKPYGARAVSWLETPDDEALNSRCLLIPMTICGHKRFLPLNDARVLSEAETIQRKLLRFRLANLLRLTLPEIAGEEKLQPRTRDLFHALTMPFGKDAEIWAVLLWTLEGQEVLREPLSVYQAAVLGSLYKLLHTFPEIEIEIKELTKYVNSILLGRGESITCSERRIGGLLTSLHLTNRQRTNAGYILWLDQDTRRRIHSMAYVYSIKDGITPYASEHCPMCQALRQEHANGSPAPPSKETPDDGANECGERREHSERGKQEPGKNHTKDVPGRPKITRPKKTAASKSRPRYCVDRLRKRSRKQL